MTGWYFTPAALMIVQNWKAHIKPMAIRYHLDTLQLGEEVVMQGHFNRRKTYMDGICKTNNKPTGSFYLEKQKLEERIVSNSQNEMLPMSAR
jgi:hypothetical protein